MTATRIFVSHSHQNNDFGLRLIGDLRQRLGEDAVWYDASGGLHGGDDWWDMILRELTSRDTFIVILSPDAVASKWVRDEMSIAWRLRNEVGLRIIPVMWQLCERRADYALLQEVSFVAPRPYDAGLAELLALLGVTDESAAHPRRRAPGPARPISSAAGQGNSHGLWTTKLGNDQDEERPAAV
jgi:hypothetical protein